MLKVIKIILIIASIFFGLPSFAGDEDGAKKFVNQVSNEVISIIIDKNIKIDNKEDLLEKKFLEVTDVDWIAKFSVGKYWRTAAEDQKKQYMELFKEYLILSYVPNFKKFTKETITVKDVKNLGDDEYLVVTEIDNPSTGKAIRVDYRVRKSANNHYGFVIFDIVGEGVSLMQTQRADFGSILSKNGLDSLNEVLKNKINSLK